MNSLKNNAVMLTCVKNQGEPNFLYNTIIDIRTAIFCIIPLLIYVRRATLTVRFARPGTCTVQKQINSTLGKLED